MASIDNPPPERSEIISSSSSSSSYDIMLYKHDITWYYIRSYSIIFDYKEWYSKE